MASKPSLYHALVSAGIQTSHQGGSLATGDIIVEDTPLTRDIVESYGVPHVKEARLIEIPFQYNKMGAEEIFLERLQTQEYGIASHAMSGDYNVIRELQKKLGHEINAKGFDELAQAAVMAEDIKHPWNGTEDLCSTVLALNHMEGSSQKSQAILLQMCHDTHIPAQTREMASDVLEISRKLELSLDSNAITQVITLDEPKAPQNKAAPAPGM